MSVFGNRKNSSSYSGPFPVSAKNNRGYFRIGRLSLVLVMLVAIFLALSFILGGGSGSIGNLFGIFQSAQKPSPTPTPVPTPTPTPTPTPIPDPPGKKSKEILVCIDPGHGGRDPGAVYPDANGLLEKEITLDMSKQLKALLEAEGIHVLMTREEDVDLSHTETSDKWDTKVDVRARPAIANEHQADFFISVHVNSYDLSKKDARKPNGAIVMYYGKTFGDLTDEDFAQTMSAAIHQNVDIGDGGISKRDLGVLRLSDMPALLVETAYITNPDDFKKLSGESFRADMAKGLAEGTKRILEKLGAYQENGIWKIYVDAETP